MNPRELIWPRACLWCEADLSPRLIEDYSGPGFKFQFFEPSLHRVLCGDCFLSVPEFKPKCLACGRLNATGRTCRGCRPHSLLSARIVAAPYRDPLVQQALAVYKYGLVRELAEPLAALLIESLRRAFLHERPSRTALVPIPLHPRRQRWRGFNQAVLLAEHLAAEFALPIKPVLQRLTSGPPLARLPVAERASYMAAAFQLNEPVPTYIERLVIVDDVWGSGATLTAASRVIRRHWPGELWAAAVAA